MTRGMIGHLVNRENYVEGVRGLAYDYILARNGVFLEAESSLIKARIKVGDAEVRGLAPLTERVELVNGRVPSYLVALVSHWMRRDYGREMYCAISWTGYSYLLERPAQKQFSTQVRYEPVPNTVIDFHSHGKMPAHFSHTDDTDDQGFRVSVVIGKLDQPVAEMSMRLGVYGYHARMSIPEVFSGDMPTDLVVAQACPERSRRERG